MAITILGDVHGDIIDNNGGVINNNYFNDQSSRHFIDHHAQQADNIQEAEVVPDVKTPSFFRTDTHSITKIQEKWEEALQIKGGKTKIIRFVEQHARKDGYFKLSGTHEQLADAFNKAQDKFTFTANDFENANKPLKK